MQTFEVRLRVRYAETDQMGVVYHANYLVWMEMGRVELCRSLGVRYREMEQQDGILLTVVEASCRYLWPARYDDEVVVRTKVERAAARLLQFSYEMLETESGRLLATGMTKHLPCGQDMRPCRFPQKYLEPFGISQHAG
ncbi:MAG: acyl-CoA thioesterase [Bryobacteraceae bacterium]|nr:acyl-CoA thioesterase [Bryobacteraceae bacterium]